MICISEHLDGTTPTIDQVFFKSANWFQISVSIVPVPTVIATISTVSDCCSPKSLKDPTSPFFVNNVLIAKGWLDTAALTRVAKS
jgi:hypothetical protein